MTEHNRSGRPRRPLRGLRGSSLVSAILLTVVLAGCASPSATTTSTPDGSTDPGNAGSAPTGLPSSADLTSSCTQPSAAGAAARLSSVELSSQGDQLVIAFTMAQQLPTDLSVTITASSGAAVAKNEQPGFSVTATLHGGAPVKVGIETATGAASAQHPEDHIHVMGNQIHLGMPSSLLDFVGPQWHWRATAVSGTARGQCPTDAGTGGSSSAVAVT